MKQISVKLKKILNKNSGEKNRKQNLITNLGEKISVKFIRKNLEAKTWDQSWETKDFKK